MVIKKRKYNFLMGIILFLSSYIMSQHVSNELGTMFIFLCLIGYVINSFDLSYYLKYFLLVSMIARAVYAFYQFHYQVILFPDSYNYLILNQKIITLDIINMQVLSSVVGSLHIGYELLNFGLFKIFQTELALYLNNIFLFILSVRLLHSLFQKEFTPRVAKTATVLLNLSMNLFIFTGTILKDSLSLFLLVIAYYFYNKLLSEKRMKNKIICIIMLLITIYYAFITRIYVGGSIIAGLGFHLLFRKKPKKKESNKFLSLFLTIIVFIILTNYLPSYVHMITRFIQKMSINNLIRILHQLISFIYSPLPWSFITQKFNIYTFLIVDTIFFMLTTPLLLNSLLKIILEKKRRKKIGIYIVPILVHAIALGTQYGTGANRQKIAIYPFIILLIILGNYKEIDQNEVLESVDIL